MTDCIFSSEGNVGMNIVFLSARGETDPDVVDASLGTPGRMAGGVVGSSFTVVDLVLVPVSTVTSVPGTVALCIESSETVARTGVEDFPT